jgi:pimeloyl-ACP methyl ester carboxylesterase
LTRLLAALAIVIALSTEALAARIYVMYGQGGILTSPGMLELADRLRKLGNTVTAHNWDDYNRIAADIRRLPASTPVVLIGFSLGAGSTTRVALGVPKRRIALAVAYDPSIWDRIPAAGKNIQRLLLYRNRGPDLWGHATITGKQVETTELYSFHMAVQFDERLHAKTITAVKRVMKGA